jgi:glycosyltransferase involved in cell wall biosynthesis
VRILIAHSFYRQLGGEDRYVGQQMALLGESHDVRLEGRENADLGSGPLTAARMISNRAERSALDRAIAEFRPDVIHLHNPYPSLGPSVHQAAARAGVPLVQTVHNFRLRCPNGFMYTEGSPCQRCLGGRYDNAVRHDCFSSRPQAVAYATALWVHRFGMRLEDKVATFIAPSRLVQRRLIEWGFAADRIALVRNFTNPPAQVAPVGANGLYLGRLSVEKGVDVLLRALVQLGDPPFEIAGDGPEAGRLRASAETLGLRRVRFLGLIPGDEVPAAIDRARYVVFPSTWDENAPLAALEAMGQARPIIASAVGGLPELAESGRGRLCVAGDSEELADAIAGYDDEDRATSDGARARQFVLEACSPAPHLEGLLNVYGRLAAPASPIET